MTKSYNLIVVIPVGPNEAFDYVLDTIDSIIHYTSDLKEKSFFLTIPAEKTPAMFCNLKCRT